MFSNWIRSAKFDIGFIIAPGILSALLVLALANSLENFSKIEPYWWIILIVGIDVGHVYSTFFRTYLDQNEFKKNQNLYLIVPLAAFVLSVFVYSCGSLIFWRLVAYLAVYHFIRQQYGFMMIYRRGDQDQRFFSILIDKIMIYLLTVYPIIYWHLTPREFNWFVKGDFISLYNLQSLSHYFTLSFCCFLGIYIIREIVNLNKGYSFNLPKNLLLLSTGISWWVGIVYLNNDLAFTATNVVAHGIPYLALIWLYEERNTNNSDFKFKILKKIISTPYLYLLALFIVAYLEEGIWDIFVWQEHQSVFPFLREFDTQASKEFLTILVPLLALPQITHYILDGFIWRKKGEWTKVLFR